MRESKFFDEIIALGRVEQGRADVLEVLELRFGPNAGDEFTQALDAITDRDKLSELHRLAIKTRSVSAFRRALTSSPA